MTHLSDPTISPERSLASSGAPPDRGGMDVSRFQRMQSWARALGTEWIVLLGEVDQHQERLQPQRSTAAVRIPPLTAGRRQTRPASTYPSSPGTSHRFATPSPANTLVELPAMASAVFFLDLKGKTLLARNYRGDIPMSAVEKFPVLLSEAEEESSAVPPCFSHEGINVTLPLALYPQAT